jgi:transcriptional regulator with XRE-family HTH domain
MVMIWQGADVRQLRQRLGWSRAELARRLGVELSAVTTWEDANQPPTEDYSDHLNFMLRHVESHCDSMARKPLAEALMAYLNLSQIHSEQVEVAITTNPELFANRDDDN